MGKPILTLKDIKKLPYAENRFWYQLSNLCFPEGFRILKVSTLIPEKRSGLTKLIRLFTWISQIMPAVPAKSLRKG